MDEIANSVLGAVIGLGEAGAKVLAPEINSALGMAKDLITSSSLDLAKALDLSGALIPSSPLAFAAAVDLAKSLVSVIPGPEGEKAVATIELLEKQAAPFMKDSEDVLRQLDVIILTGERIEEETHRRVKGAATVAYQALDDAVAELLAIEKGTARIQRVAPDTIKKLDLVVERFVELRKVSDTNAWGLGQNATALMSYGDSTKTFGVTLRDEKDKLNAQLKNNEDARARHKENLNVLKKDESTMASRRREAVESLENFWNQIAFEFKPSEKAQRKSIIADADEGLRKNRASQAEVNNKIRSLYLLDTLTGWATRALDVVIATVARVAQDFQAKFRRITSAQETSGRLLAGLLRMANEVQDTNFRTSRDNSLRVVVSVLQSYHALRADHGSLDIVGIEDRRIHRAIVQKLGQEGVKGLMEPPARVDDDDDDGINSI